MREIFIILFLLVKIVTADIRMDNNELSAQGQWTIVYNPNGANAILNKSTEVIDSNSDISEKDNVHNQQDKTKRIVEKLSQQNQSQHGQKNSLEREASGVDVFNKLASKTGSCLIYFYNSIISDQLQTNQKANSLLVRFYDPKYLDQKIIILKVGLRNYIETMDNWQVSSAKINYTFFDNFQQKFYGQITASYKVGHSNMSFYIGDYQISISYNKKQYTVWFSLVMLIINFAILYAAIRLGKRQISVQKISIICLYHNVFFYIYLSTFFLIVGMAALPGPMSIMMVCGFIQIFVCVKLIRKFENIIQRVSNISRYCLFYCGIFIYFWLLFNYFYTPVFIFANSLALVPQIIHNMRFSNKLGPEYSYLMILASPQFYFLYLKGFPDNALRYRPDYLVCAGLILIFWVQLWVVHQQNLKGPFFFVRKEWMPNFYQYYHKFKLNSKCDLYEQQCAICLCVLSEQDPITASRNKAQLQNQEAKNEEISSQSKISKIQQITLMVTPCQHKFHSACLQQWLQYKRECPTDRSQLPILYK